MRKQCKTCGCKEFIMTGTITAEARCDSNGEFIGWVTLEAGLDNPIFTEIQECAECGSKDIIVIEEPMKNKDFIVNNGVNCPYCGGLDQSRKSTEFIDDITFMATMKCENCGSTYEKYFDLSGWGEIEEEE